MLESVSVSGLIESMRYNGGHSTKQSSTVTMAVTHKFATEVATLIEEFQKKGIEPKEGLIRLELIAHYDDGSEDGIMKTLADVYNSDGSLKAAEPLDDSKEQEQIIDDLTENVDEAIDGEEGETDAEEDE